MAGMQVHGIYAPALHGSHDPEKANFPKVLLSHWINENKSSTRAQNQKKVRYHRIKLYHADGITFNHDIAH